MLVRMPTSIMTLILLSALSASAAAQDARLGEVVFKRVCSACHISTADGPRKLGPSLFGVVGRKAGSLEGYKYSAAKRDPGLYWTLETLNPYLLNPREYLPGTTMAYAGVKSDVDRESVIEFLATLK